MICACGGWMRRHPAVTLVFLYLLMLAAMWLIRIFFEAVGP